MRTAFLSLAACCGPGSVRPAQRLEKTIAIPDSLSGAPSPCTPADDLTDELVSVVRGSTVIASDGTTSRRLVRMRTGEPVRDVCCNRRDNKVCSASHWSHSVIVIDAAGRKVMDLHPGANDVSRLAPGVCFVREEPSAASRPQGRPDKIGVRCEGYYRTLPTGHLDAGLVAA